MSDRDFASLQKIFKGDLVTSADPDYAKAIARWALNAQRNAKVVAFVKDAEDISQAINYAKANKFPIAIRGGGHSPVGASSTEGGLVIDLSRYLNGARVDSERKLAFVGGGALWETVDKTAIEHDLATVGGTVNHTGVGGHALGGGYGWLSSAYGLSIDNLIQATVVVADGSILIANDEENPDLFWGIRGGGCNFGVCTEFVLKLHPQRRTVYSGAVVFLADKLEKLLALTTEWWDKGPSEKEGMMHVFTQGHDKSGIIVVMFFYNGSEEEGRSHFKPFFDLEPVADRTREMPYEEVNAIQNPYVRHGEARYMKGVIQTKPHHFSALQSLERAAQLSNDEFTATLVVNYFPLAKIQSVSDDATAFPRTVAPNVLITVAWKHDTPDNAKHGRDAANELTDIIVQGQAELRGTSYSAYGNYNHPVVNEGETARDPAKVMYGGNYPKLQQIKKKYDPEVIFNKWFPITPAT